MEKKEDKPLYVQVKDRILKNILDKTWEEGSLIPTEKELMQEFDVSRNTLRQAVMLLENQNVLKKIQGKGTIILKIDQIHNINKLKGFAELVIENGQKPTSVTRYSEFRNDLFAQKKILELGENDSVFVINRVRLVDDVPIAVETTYWPEHIGKILENQDLNNPFYSILEEERIYLESASDNIKAINATQETAELLNIQPGEAVLEVSRLSKDISGKFIEYAVTRYRSDSYVYNINLSR